MALGGKEHSHPPEIRTLDLQIIFPTHILNIEHKIYIILTSEFSDTKTVFN